MVIMSIITIITVEDEQQMCQLGGVPETPTAEMRLLLDSSPDFRFVFVLDHLVHFDCYISFTLVVRSLTTSLPSELSSVPSQATT